jgi:hypothetical protein
MTVTIVHHLGFVSSLVNYQLSASQGRFGCFQDRRFHIRVYFFDNTVYDGPTLCRLFRALEANEVTQLSSAAG